MLSFNNLAVFPEGTSKQFCNPYRPWTVVIARFASCLYISLRTRCVTTSLILALVLSVVGSAEADLIPMDSEQFGQGSLTFDTDTGLSWLDPTFSTGISYSGMLPELNEGEQFDGFRHATADEVAAFFRHAGIPAVGNRSEWLPLWLEYEECLVQHPCTGEPGPAGLPICEEPGLCIRPPTIGELGSSEHNYEPVQSLLALTGITSWQGSYGEIIGITGTYELGGVYVGLADYVGGRGYQVTVGGLRYGVNTSPSTVGHWLVMVPEPTSGMVFLVTTYILVRRISRYRA